MNRIFPLAVLLLATSFTQAQTYVKGSFTWKSVTRHYKVMIPPKNVPLSGELVITLHGLQYAGSSSVPDNNYYGWEYTCAQKGAGCIAVAAVSTWDPDATSKNSPGYWAWNAGFFNNMVFSKKSPPYTPYPDDIGYLRQLIVTLEKQYPAINPKKVYVVGFSVGAFMASLAAVELSDVVAAVSINSGSLQSSLAPPSLPTIPNPISVIEYHGTLDNNPVGVDPCATKWDWNKYLPEKSTVDGTFTYFATQNACKVKTTTLALCQTIKGVKTFNNNDATSCKSNGEVKFVWEPGVLHKYMTSHNPADLAFFRKHAKP